MGSPLGTPAGGDSQSLERHRLGEHLVHQHEHHSLDCQVALEAQQRSRRVPACALPSFRARVQDETVHVGVLGDGRGPGPVRQLARGVGEVLHLLHLAHISHLQPGFPQSSAAQEARISTEKLQPGAMYLVGRVLACEIHRGKNPASVALLRGKVCCEVHEGAYLWRELRAEQKLVVIHEIGGDLQRDARPSACEGTALGRR